MKLMGPAPSNQSYQLIRPSQITRGIEAFLCTGRKRRHGAGGTYDCSHRRQQRCI